MFFKRKSLVLSGAFIAFLSFNVHSTIVEIRTSLGDIQVNLFDDTTPETVANFLTYVDSGAFASTVVHRSASGFIVQAGGFQYTGPVTGAFTLDKVAAGSAVVNEPKLSNVRGTIAMAKIENQPNSATSEWFINLANNSANLDRQNGGFSVFGQVIGDGMDVIDAIAALNRLSAGGPFSNLPIRSYTQADVSNNVPITDDNLVVITDVVVIDASVDSAADLQPVINTLINQQPSVQGSDSGGALGWMLLGGLLTIVMRRSIGARGC